MFFLFLSGISVVLGLSILLIGIMLKKQSEYFEKNKKQGRAEVVGYNRFEGSDRYSLAVRLLDIDNTTVYGCQSGVINIADYPVGRVVSVLYSGMSIGNDFVEIHLVENLPADKLKASRIIIKTALVLFAVSAIMIVIGLIKILL